MKLILKSMGQSPQHTLRDLQAAGAAQRFSERLGVQSVGLDARADGTDFDLPIFFQGEHDSLTPVERLRAFFGEVPAPHKDFALITEANHFAACGSRRAVPESPADRGAAGAARRASGTDPSHLLSTPTTLAGGESNAGGLWVRLSA